MRVPPKVWRTLGIGLAVLLLIGLVVRQWVVPGLIARAIQSRYDGKVAVGGWWLGRTSGITGLSLREGDDPKSPVWASAESIATDLSLGDILSGRVNPRTITLKSPALNFRLNADGTPATKVPLKGGKAGDSGTPAALPTILVEDARVTLAQAGRTPMVINGVGGKLETVAGGEQLSAQALDPTWGSWNVAGLFDPGFQKGDLTLSGTGVQANAEKVAAVPFVPKEVWENILPTGPADLRIALKLALGTKQPVAVRTTIELKQTTVEVKGLGLVATDATGQVVVDGGLVEFLNVKGQALGGRVSSPTGTMDFTHPKPTFALQLVLGGIEAAKAPAKWQLAEAGFTGGRLDGKADLKVVLGDGGFDLTGTTGEATITGATLQGIPVKSLRLNLKAQGEDLQYAADDEGSAALPGFLDPIAGPLARSREALWGLAIALQPPSPTPAPAAAATPKRTISLQTNPPAKPGTIRLPKSITTHIELERVDLKTFVNRAREFGISIPVPIAGQISLKATATLPLGGLRDIAQYKFHGEATLEGASIDGVDLGHLQATLGLNHGVLELKDFRGRLVDLPTGGVGGVHPPALGATPAQGPLLPGGFRGQLRVEISPPGRLAATFQGVSLPLGELAAPALPRPTPLAGALTFDAKAEAAVASLSDPQGWEASGHASSERVSYQGTTLDAASTSFALKAGKLSLPDLAARLNGKPLKGRLATDVAAPYAFDAALDVNGWDISDVLTLIPGAPSPAPADGELTARADAKGTLIPLELRTTGAGRIARLQAGTVAVGDLPFTWTTQGDVIDLRLVDASPFGGHLNAEARIPAKGEGPIRAAARLKDLDTSLLSAALPGGKFKLTGKAGGSLDVLVPPHPARMDQAIEANLTLAAPDLTFHGVPTEHLAVAIWARKGAVHYDVTADSLGGKFKSSGDIPPVAASEPDAPRHLEGVVRAVGFGLGGLWPALDLAGTLGPLKGEAAVDANIRIPLAEPSLYARAVAEARNLRWNAVSLGHLRGTLTASPASLRLSPLEGELLGGTLRGDLWSEVTPPAGRRSGFDLNVEALDLSRITPLLPESARRLSGLGTLRGNGSIDVGGLRATAEADVPRGHAFGFPFQELRIPLVVTLPSGPGIGVVKSHHWSIRAAGGRAEGEARVNIGEDRAFAGSIAINLLDLETLTRILSGMRKPLTGRISGTASASGHDYLRRRGLRGRIDLDLDDASLFELPLFHQLGRFLGAAQNGIFEDGDLHATLGDREATVEEFTLQGRLIQLHGTGTVGYDEALNMELLVNTAQLIPETGQALVRIIPGLGQVLGRREQSVAVVGNFLSNRLLKFRVTGTLKSPVVNADATVLVGEAAVGFFGGVLKLPFGFLR